MSSIRGLLDELPTLKIQFSHFAGGIGRYLGRIRGFQQRDKWGTAKIDRHGRQPRQAVRPLSRSSAVLRYCRLGRPDHAAEWGADWVRFGFEELGFLATRLRHRLSAGRARAGEVAAYVEAVRALGGNGRAIVAGANAEKLIPDLKRRLAARAPARPR